MMDESFEKGFWYKFVIFCFLLLFLAVGERDFTRFINNLSFSNNNKIKNPQYKVEIDVISVKKITLHTENYFDIIYIERNSEMNKRIKINTKNVIFDKNNRYIYSVIKYNHPNGPEDEIVISAIIKYKKEIYEKINNSEYKQINKYYQKDEHARLFSSYKYFLSLITNEQ